LTFLVLLTSGLQYLVQKLNYARDLARIDQIVTAARTAAWGPKLTRLNVPRKASIIAFSLINHVTWFQVKVPLGGGTYDGDGEYIPQKTLEMVVDGDHVFLVSCLAQFSDKLEPKISSLKKMARLHLWTPRQPLRPLLARRGLLLCYVCFGPRSKVRLPSRPEKKLSRTMSSNQPNPMKPPDRLVKPHPS
jgi:hypothetical protein